VRLLWLLRLLQRLLMLLRSHARPPVHTHPYACDFRRGEIRKRVVQQRQGLVVPCARVGEDHGDGIARGRLAVEGAEAQELVEGGDRGVGAMVVLVVVVVLLMLLRWR